MRRRDTLAFMLAVGARPLVAQAQPAGKVYRIGWLSNSSYATTLLWPEFVAGMRERGWIEGQHYTVDHLVSEGDSARFPALAEQAVQRRVDVIVCAGTPPTMAAMKATTTIPILFFYVVDPVAAGFVASLARPGGNVTGLGGLSPQMYVKQLALLKEVAPKATRITMLYNPTLHVASVRADTEAAARSLKVTLRPTALRSQDELEQVLAQVAGDKPDALLIMGQPFLFGQRARLARFAIDQRLPAIIGFEEVAEAGLLMSYGSRVIDDVRRLPHYVDRIFRGTKPADLPVEQATRVYLTLNLKTAKAIGIRIPTAVMQRADRLIE